MLWRVRLLVGLAAAIGLGGTSCAEEAGMPKDLEGCIRSNVVAVEATIASLKEAAEFLVENVCAKNVAAFEMAQKRAQVARNQDLFRKACEARKAKPKAPQAGTADSEDSYDACAQQEQMAEIWSSEGLTLSLLSGTSPPAAKGLASKLLLEARLKRIERGEPGARALQ